MRLHDLRPASSFAPALLALLLAACPGPEQMTDSGDSDNPSTTTPATSSSPTTTGFDLFCMPGTSRCADDVTVETCKGSGLAYEKTACSTYQACIDGECIGPCEKVADAPSSNGCEFYAIRMRSHNELPGDKDALIVGNTDPKLTATVQLTFAANNSHKDEPLGDPVVLAPGESHIFQLNNDQLQGYSTVRIGGVFRVSSDVPIAAYLHSSLENKASNDSSLLLPTHTLRQKYVIPSYPGFADPKTPDTTNGRPSYFNVIALEDNTVVSWIPRADTAGDGIAIMPLTAGQTGQITLSRFDVLQVGSSSKTNLNYQSHDVSGTLVTADKKISVLGATDCAFVPWGSGFCNHLQEQAFPLDYWGKTYVGAHSPVRNNEKHYWRVFAGEAGVTVTTDPPQAGTPFTLLERGAYKDLEIPNGVSFVFQATGPILPVQYLAGNTAAGGIGDPSMYQMVPVEQWLKRYVFVTGINYGINYAQVIRRFGGADVSINGQVVTGYYLINTVSGGKYEIADVLLAGGDMAQSYLAESADDFNVVVVGYTNNAWLSAYAYPGGMGLKRIYDP